MQPILKELEDMCRIKKNCTELINFMLKIVAILHRSFDCYCVI